MEIIVDAACGGAGDAGDLLKVLEGGALDRAGGAEMHQQGALAARADSGDLVEWARRHALRTFLAVGADGEAVGLVTQALKIEEQRRIGRQRHLAAAREMEYLATRIAV